MKLTITTLVIIEDNEVQDVIHSLNEDLTKAQQEIVDQVNDLYGNEKITFNSLQDIKTTFNKMRGIKVHLECQEISLQRNGTILKDIEL